MCVSMCINIYIAFVKATIIHESIHKSVIILWEEDDVKQLYLVLKVSCWRTNNLSARYNYHQKIDNIMVSLI